MKTESNVGYQLATAPPRSSPSAGQQGMSSSSSSLPSAYPGVAQFGRAALELLDDITMLFDPTALLGAPRPVKERSVSVMPQPAAQQSGHRDRSDSEPSEVQFRSPQKPSTTTPKVSTSTSTSVSSPPGLQRVSGLPAALESVALVSTIGASRLDALDDLLVPVRAGNAWLATVMMPPTTFCGVQRTPAAWRVSQLRGFMDDGNWQEVVRRLPNHTPQRAVALAVASCPQRESKGSFDRVAAGPMDRESKAGADGRVDSLIVAPATKVPDGQTPLALQVFGERQAAAVIGSTYHAAAAGGRMDCQDGVFLSPHCTVVTDGLGGHESDHAARNVRVAQAATGQFITRLVEAIARTETRPAEFLRLHLHALLRMVDHAVASALTAPFAEKDRPAYLGCVTARAAFVAVANLRDGTVAFGVGDCTAHLFAREADGALRVVTFTPQPDDVPMSDVGGLGDTSLREGQFAMRPFPPGVVERIVVGSDGVFNAHQGHLELVAGRTPSSQGTGRAQVGQHALADMTPAAACDEIITRLTERTRAYWATQQGQERPGVAGLDDVALVVRDFKK